MIDTVECINQVTGNSAIFERLHLSPFMLKSIDGVSSFKNSVTTEDHTMTDGAEYLGSVQEKRNIVITGKMLGDELIQKDQLYEVFNRGDLGKIIVTDSNGTQRSAEYYTESVDADGDGLIAKTFSISLICPDPAFYDLVDTIYSMSNWLHNFEFVHQFKSDREEFGSQSKVKLVNILYRSGIPTGITIELSTIGVVKNPVITNSLTGQHIKVGSDTLPFILNAGEKLVITTADGNKHLYKESNEKRVEVNQYLTEDSEFIQLTYGENPIAYDADSGVEFLTVDITYKQKYRGA